MKMFEESQLCLKTEHSLRHILVLKAKYLGTRGTENSVWSRRLPVQRWILEAGHFDSLWHGAADQGMQLLRNMASTQAKKSKAGFC